ncbi:MAG: hypothetical protein KBC56_05360 [Flavobacterium sp.]|nr:hypothetical protein [Flavobacterium sp.]
MTSEGTNQKIIHFFENIEKYYGCKTEITEGLYCKSEINNPDFTTWNLSEFTLIRSGYRNNGERFMFEGEKMYFEISAKNIISLGEPGRNKFDFIEQYSETVFRITKIRFHHKY